MKKATIEYDLSNEEGKFEFRMSMEGHKYLMILQDLDSHLRQIYKYGDDDKISEFAQTIREKMSELAVELGVNLND